MKADLIVEVKADLIVEVLDISRTNVWPRKALPKTQHYVDMLHGRYLRYRDHVDFRTADMLAQKETVEAILQDPEVSQ